MPILRRSSTKSLYRQFHPTAAAMHAAVVSPLMGCPAFTSFAPQGDCQRAIYAGIALQKQRWTLPRCAAAAGVAPPAGAAAQGSRRRQLQSLLAPRAASSAAVMAASDGSEDPEEWVEVGRIGPPHGVRGEMKVQPLTDFPEDRLGEPGPRWLQAPAPKIGRRRPPPPEEVELEWGRSMISKGNEVWLVKLEGVESPEEAAELRGHTLLIPASARQPLEDEDEFYVQDLVGLRVVLQATGEEIGHVSDVFDGTGTHDVLRIQLTPAKLEQLAAAAAASSSSAEEEEEEEEEAAAAAAGGGGASGPRHVLLPFAKALVPVVDLAGGRMEVTPPEGLLELAAPSNMRRPRRENRGRRERRRTRPKGQGGAAASGTDAAAVSPQPLHSDVE